MGRTIADRRWWHLFLGRKPRAFGRYQTVKALVVDAPSADRVIVGTIAKPAALIAIEDQVQICAIAAPRSGKTSALVAPAVLEHAGPVVTTSTKTDVVAATLERRARIGEALVWDPFGPDTCSWDLLQGCEDWGHALLVARWLVAAMQLGTSSSSQYFDEAAQELAAPLLHAAALGSEHTMLDVYGWVRDTKLTIPKRILTSVSNDDALARLDSIYRLNPRQRDGITGTMQVQLKAYGHPAAARTARRGAAGITPDRLFDGAPNTVYLVAGREHQRMLAPLVITMLCSLLYAASERENRTGRPLAPQALFALDETAQIAPLQDLPQILSVSLSSGIRFLTVWHSLAQIRERYGPDARRDDPRALPSQGLPRLDHRRRHPPRARAPARPAAARARRPHALARHAHRPGPAAPARRPGPARARRAATGLLHPAALVLRPRPAAPARAVSARRAHRLARAAAAIVGSDDALRAAVGARVGERVDAAVILDVDAGALEVLLPRRHTAQLLLAVGDEHVWLLDCRRRTLAERPGAVRHRVPRSELLVTSRRRRLDVHVELSWPAGELFIAAGAQRGPATDRVIGLLLADDLERHA